MVILSLVSRLISPLSVLAVGVNGVSNVLIILLLRSVSDGGSMIFMLFSEVLYSELLCDNDNRLPVVASVNVLLSSSDEPGIPSNDFRR